MTGLITPLFCAECLLLHTTQEQITAIFIRAPSQVSVNVAVFIGKITGTDYKI